jgi:signal transduction histidine kinase/DNA-binding NarL/FixJ family response regulator
MATILVVDDRPPNREILVALLGCKGHRIVEAGDGREALALVRERRPDLVICDILMPIIDGYEFVRQLRAEPDIAAIRVIFHSAHHHAREAHTLARAAGVSHVLTKPFEPEELFAVVDGLLATPPAKVPPLSPDYRGKHLQLVSDKLSETVNDLQIANERLRALIDLSLQLVSLRDPTQLLDAVCRGARELIGARQGLLAVGEPSEHQATQRVASGMAADVAAGLGPIRLDKGPLAGVMAERRPLRLSHLRRTTQAATLPSGYPRVRSLLAAPIASTTTVYGWICLTDKLGADSFSSGDELLLSLLAALVGRGHENGSFYVKLQHQAAEQLQTLSRRLVDVQESERRQLSRELHDRVGQNLTALGINLDILRTQGVAAQHPELRVRLADSVALVEATTDAIENVMAELRPPMLDDHGLLSALQWHARQFSQRTGIEVVVHGGEAAQRPGPEIEITLFRIAQEALNNVAKHSRAVRADLELGQFGADYVLAIVDPGVGFDPQALSGPGRGMATMRERAQAVGGRFEVSAALAQGTRIIAVVPLRSGFRTDRDTSEERHDKK